MAPPHIFAGACALSAFTASASCMNASFSWMRLMLFCVVTFSFVVAGWGAVLRCGIFSKDFEKIFFLMYSPLKSEVKFFKGCWLYLSNFHFTKTTKY